MADQSAIDAVKLQLADEANDLGITDIAIGAWLDSGLSQTKTILAGWRAIAAKSAATEDVSESGSSRTVRLHERAVEMIRDWQARSDAEDKATVTDTLGRGRFASHRATRV
ncbi:gp23 [Mycobacterium phage Barnyard]|uniref:Uncharacterized protein n=1 Tax=Mycobacterium phage Barnyard TaxID=205880 RepID=Q856E9_9CAUD|nr:gp23 [Mycobacterium phage Barnyard]AAN02077.1 hypothetical protein PBI_BARNYARD_23 [Mycobacterium phage Barnyard]